MRKVIEETTYDNDGNRMAYVCHTTTCDENEYKCCSDFCPDNRPEYAKDQLLGIIDDLVDLGGRASEFYELLFEKGDSHGE